MRSSNLDKYICIITLFLFLYSFFVIGYEVVYLADLPYNAGFLPVEGKDDIVGITWPTSMYIAPVAFMMFFYIMLFSEELKPVDRFWVRKKIRYAFTLLRRRLRSGLEEYRDWKH